MTTPYYATEPEPQPVPEMESPPEDPRPLVAVAFGAVALTAIAVTVRSAQSGRADADIALIGLVLGALLAWIAGWFGARLPAGARHLNNFHYLAFLPALGSGWLLMTEASTSLLQHFIGLTMPFAAAVGVGQLLASSCPVPKVAALAAVGTFFLAATVGRPFSPTALNVAIPLVGAFFAWRTVVELRRPLPDPGEESNYKAIGLSQIAMAATGAPMLLVLIFMASATLFALVLQALGMATPPKPKNPPSTDLLVSVLSFRLTFAGMTAASAAALASLRYWRSASPLRAALGWLLAGCGALWGGQSLSFAGVAFAFLGALLIAFGLALTFGGGTAVNRGPRPFIAAALGATLALNLIELPSGFAGNVTVAWAAGLAIAEGAALAVLWGTVYWFPIAKVRAMFPQPRKRAPVVFGPPPDLPPGAPPLPKY